MYVYFRQKLSFNFDRSYETNIARNKRTGLSIQDTRPVGQLVFMNFVDYICIILSRNSVQINKVSKNNAVNISCFLGGFFEITTLCLPKCVCTMYLNENAHRVSYIKLL